MPSKQRLTLFGHIERINSDNDQIHRLKKCFVRAHPDALHWTPGSGDSPHEAFWCTFHVDRVYRVGGFGDESNIGWIDMDLWKTSGTSHAMDVGPTDSEEALLNKQETWKLFAEQTHPKSPVLRFQP